MVIQAPILYVGGLLSPLQNPVKLDGSLCKQIQMQGQLHGKKDEL